MQLYQKHPRFPIIQRPGEQLSFQPQPPPILNSPKISYNELNIKRNIDTEVVERIQMHIREIDLQSMIAQECSKNETLEQYWLRTEG